MTGKYKGIVECQNHELKREWWMGNIESEWEYDTDWRRWMINHDSHKDKRKLKQYWTYLAIACANRCHNRHALHTILFHCINHILGSYRQHWSQIGQSIGWFNKRNSKIFSRAFFDSLGELRKANKKEKRLSLFILSLSLFVRTNISGLFCLPLQSPERKISLFLLLQLPS